jgi:hypothetical protein
MREEVWRNMLLATLNAKYARARCQRAHRIVWWMSACSALIGSISVAGAVATKAPPVVWSIFAAVAGGMAVINNLLGRDEAKALFMRAAQEWEDLAEAWLRHWTQMQEFPGREPQAPDMELLRARTSAAKRIVVHLPEDTKLTELCWEETLVLRGAA